jgi:hypothetical protein
VGADRTSAPAKESEKPALVCTICGLKKTDEAIQWNSVTGLQEAYCKRCQAQQLHRIPDRSEAPGKVDESLDLPGRRGPGGSPDVKESEKALGNQSTQAGSLRGAAQVIFAEVGRRRRTDDPLLDQALESLLGMGPDGRAACVEALASEHGPTVLVAGRYFLASNDGRDRDLVVERISARAPGSVGGVLLRMLYHVDPVRANPELLAKLIDHPQNSVRTAAHNILKDAPKAEWIPLLEPALHSESADARWRAVDLIASTGDAAAVPLLFEHLHDSRAKVATRAVEFLARFPGEQVEVELMRRAFG